MVTFQLLICSICAHAADDMKPATTGTSCTCRHSDVDAPFKLDTMTVLLAIALLIPMTGLGVAWFTYGKLWGVVDGGGIALTNAHFM